MSGGSMDYAYAKINAVADDIERSIAEGRSRPQLRRRLEEHLRECADVLRAIEWADSGDTGPDQWVEAARRLLEHEGRGPDEAGPDARAGA